MDIGRYLDNIDKKFTRKETTKMKQYDYLIVGSGLYGAVFAQQATAKGKKVLVIDKRPNIAGNVYTEDIEKIHVHKYGAHIFHTNNKKYGITLQSLQSLIDSQTHQLQITKENYIPCHLICTHSIRCGV